MARFHIAGCPAFLLSPFSRREYWRNNSFSRFYRPYCFRAAELFHRFARRTSHPRSGYGPFGVIKNFAPFWYLKRKYTILRFPFTNFILFHLVGLVSSLAPFLLGEPPGRFWGLLGPRGRGAPARNVAFTPREIAARNSFSHSPH